MGHIIYLQAFNLMSFRNSSAPPPPPQPLFNQETLQQRLQALIKGARESWTYAIFWRSSNDYSGKSVLSWGDGYYEGDDDKGRGKSKVNSSAAEQEHRKKVLRELNSLISGSAPSPNDEEVTDAEWFFLVSMTQSFANGSGLPGQAFFNSSPVWVAGAASLASSSCDRARHGQVFGLQTIVCIPSENGVVELGSTEVIFQSSDLMKTVRVLFHFSNMEAGSRPVDQGENDPSSFCIREPSRAVEVKDSANPRANTNQQTAFNKRLSNEKCSETASSTDGAKAFDNTIGEGGFLTMAVNSTSVERHARGEKTINVAGSSLKDATAESTGDERALSLLAARPSKSGPNDGLANCAALQTQKKSSYNELLEQLGLYSLLVGMEQIIVEACKLHRLPGAQVWVSCRKQSLKYGCRLSDENQNHCHPEAPIVPKNSPLEHPIFGFIRACREHDHLIEGEGVVGKAFATNQPWFSTDISSTPKTDYPLSEYARMFGMRSAVAVPLHIITRYNSTMDYVYEFFLPFNCTDHEEQMKTLTALISTLQRGVEKIRQTNSYLESQLVLDPVNRVDYSLAYIESSSLPEESLRGPLSDRRLLPEPSYQNNKWLDQTPSIEPDEVFEDAVGQGSFLSMAVNETSHGTGEKTSLKDATVKGTGGKSNKRDWAWEYCYPIEGNSNGVICKFCSLEIKGGGITRFKSHINPLDPCKNVKKCQNMSPEDKVKVAKGMKGGYNKRK